MPDRLPDDDLMARSRALLTEMDETLRKLKETMTQIDHHTASPVSGEQERCHERDACKETEEQELDGPQSDESDD